MQGVFLNFDQFRVRFRVSVRFRVRVYRVWVREPRELGLGTP